MKRLLPALALLLVGAPQLAAAQVTRTEAIVTARAYANHRWSTTADNITNSRCPSTFYPARLYHYVGDFIGVAYDWGGFQSLRTFDEKIADRHGAGSTAGSPLLTPHCSAGVDCSGFVNRCWKTDRYTTATIPNITTLIAASAMLPGDVWNDAGYHVGIFSGMLSNGIPENIESLAQGVTINRRGGYTNVQGFEPRRYNQITGTSVEPTTGTLDAPIVISSFPYSTQGDTSTSRSSVYDRYGCASQNESGPEIFYQATFDRPGTLRVSAISEGGADIDVHVLSQRNTDACVARADVTVEHPVGCGTYFIVADSFSGVAKAGKYTLSATFTPSGNSSCASAPAPEPFNPKGKLGDRCATQNTPNHPWCDWNQDTDGCLAINLGDGNYDSFCSKACETNADCAGMGTGACCEPLSDGSNYCIAADYCGEASDGGLSSGTSGTSGTSGASGTSGTSGASGASGASGTSGSSGDDDTPGGSSGRGGRGNQASDDEADAGEGGCAVARVGRGAPDASWLLVGLGLVAFGSRRRRSR